MAAGGTDGSLKFDTAISVEGFEKGISTLSKAMDRLTSAVDRLSDNVIRRFNGIGTAASDISQGTREAAGGVEEIAEASKTAEQEAEKLQKQMDKIEVSFYEGNTNPEAGIPERTEQVDPDNIGYDRSALEFIEQYGEDTKQARQHTNEFKAGIETLTQELKELESQGMYFGDDEYDKTYMKLAKVKQALADYKKEMASPAESRPVLDAGTLQGQIDKLGRELKRLSESGSTFGNPLYDSTYSALKKAEAALKEYQASLVNAKAETRQYTGVLDSLKAAVGNLPGFFKQAGARALTAFKTAPAKLFRSALNGVASAGKKAAAAIASLGLKGLKAAASGAVRGLTRIGRALLGVGKSAQKGQKGFSMLGMLGKSLIFSMVFRALSGITNAFREGIQNFAQYSGSFNSVMTSFTGSLAQLKNTFASAFAPLSSIAIPALDALIQKLIQAINVAGQFLAAITGKGTFTKAVKVNKDYAASLKKTGGAASQAGKDAKKALAPFDDLVQIQQQGADASGGGGGGIDPSQMFTEEAIDGGIGDLANKLKELFEAGDWEGMGQLIGGRINEAVQSFTQFISWENVGAQITAFVTAFTALFNSLVANIDWYAIGIMFGTGIDTLANTLYLLLTQTDWQLLGTALALGLNGIVDSVDWDLFGATIGAYFQAKISAMYGFVTTADWPGIGRAIGTALNGLAEQIDWIMLGLLFAEGLSGAFGSLGEFALTFDWAGLGSSVASSLSTFFQNFDWIGAGSAISNFVLGLLNAFVTFIKETDWAALGSGVAEMALAIDWRGLLLSVIDVVLQTLKAVVLAAWPLLSTIAKDLWDGFCKGVKEFFSDPKAFIKTNITDPFVKYFKELFGIHSPSTVMAGMGQYLWDGFCKGVKEFFADPGAFIKANITDPFVKGIKGLLGIHSPSTVLAGIGSNTVAGFNQGVTKEQGASQNVVQSWASGVASWFKDKFGISSGDSDESKKWAAGIMGGFNSSISGNYKNSQGVMETWADGIRKWFAGADASKGVNELSWIKFADLIIQAFKTKMEDSHAETQAPMETWARNVREWFWGDGNPEGTGGMYEAFYNMARRINEGFAKGMSDFAYMAKDAIRKWASEAMDAAEEEFDINSPSKEFYGIAEYVVRGFNDGISAMASSSRNTVQKWLDGVMDVFDGVDIQLPVGISIPNAASYLPRMARGIVVPPRAGEMSASMRNTAGYGQEEALGYLISRMDEMISRLQAEGSRPVQIVLNLTGNLAALARVLKPELDKEAARKGVSLVIVGG